MTTEYHKINAPFKRDMQAKTKPLIMGDWALPEFGYLSDNQWEFTEKVDGTNIRIEFHNNGLEFKGRTDNADIPSPLLSFLKETFVLERILPNFDLGNSTIVTLYGEGYGPKINGGGKYRSDPSFVLFDVKIGDWWLDRKNVDDIASKLGIDSVPVLGTGTLWEAIHLVKGSNPAGKKYGVEFGYWNGNDGLKSAWGDFEAEGIVARPVVPLFDRKGARIITKIKGRDFK